MASSFARVAGTRKETRRGTRDAFRTESTRDDERPSDVGLMKADPPSGSSSLGSDPSPDSAIAMLLPPASLLRASVSIATYARGARGRKRTEMS